MNPPRRRREPLRARRLRSDPATLRAALGFAPSAAGSAPPDGAGPASSAAAAVAPALARTAGALGALSGVTMAFVAVVPVSFADLCRAAGIEPSTARTQLLLGVLIGGPAGAALTAARVRLVPIAPREVLTATAVAMAALTVVTGLLLGSWVILPSLLSGAAMGGAAVLSRVAVAELATPGTAARVLSMRLSGEVGAFALLLGLGVAGQQLADLSWRGDAVLVGVCGAALAAAARSLAVAAGAQLVPVTSPVGEPVDPPPLWRERFRQVYGRGTLQAGAAVSVGLGAAGLPVKFAVLELMRTQWLASPTDAARLLVVLSIGALIGLSVARRGDDQRLWRGPEWLAAGSADVTFLAVVALAAVGASHWYGPVVLAIALSGGLLAVIAARLDAVVLSVVRRDLRLEAMALLTMYALGAGTLAGLSVVQVSADRFGWGWAVAFAGMPLLIALGALTRTVRRAGVDLDARVRSMAERVERAHRPARAEELLVCRGIDFSYGAVQVLFEVDFSVDRGEMVALLGTNGAGKSTLLRVISGLGFPTAGSVRFAGEDITFRDTTARVPLGITQVPGGKAVVGPLTVVANLRIYGYSLGADRGRVDRGIESAFATFPRLAERRDQRAQTLSGGEQQMLALSKALLLQPSLLLIDELSLGLAPKVVGELLGMVRTIAAGGTAVVLVEQSVNVALSLVDHAYFMEKGEIRFDGRSADLLERPDLLRSVFLQGAAKGLQ